MRPLEGFILNREVTYCIAVKSLEDINGLLEEIRNLFLWCIAGVARRLQSANTSPMFLPFMFPEGLIIAIYVDPVFIHVGEQVRLSI
jgi:hypothetical protein